MSKKTQKEQSSEDILYSRCTPFVLVHETKTKAKSRPRNSNSLLKAFKDDLLMGEEEVRRRLEAYNSEVKDLFDATMSGDELATACLVEYANVAIQMLEQISHRNPEALYPLSAYNIQWPSFIGHKEFFAEKNSQLMERIKLGEKSPFSHKWNPKSPSTFIAYSMLYWLQENQVALQLPPLTKMTFTHWFQCGWEGLSHYLQGHPERYEYLRKPYERSAHQKVKKNQEKRNTETVIREVIKHALKKSFKTVTKNYLR